MINQLQKLLNDETVKGLRNAISDFSAKELDELSSLTDQAFEENCTEEILKICEEHLSHSKDSITALFISGMIGVKNGDVDDSTLMTLVDMLKKNHKEKIIENLCKKILDYDQNNKFALKTLGNCYLSEGNEEAWEIFKKIVKIDLTEADLAKTLAEHYLNDEDNKDLALEYYKKALLRYVNAANYNATKEMWTKLVELKPDEFDFFQLVRGKITKTLGEFKTTTLMQELYDYYKKNQNWDTAISILKQNLEVEPKDSWAKKELTECYRGKYKNHSHLEECLTASGLTQNYRDVFESINDFEKHIAFDKDNYVYHREWKVGIITKIDAENLYIYFGKDKKGNSIKKKMSIKMAISALKPLSKDHIWVLKATEKTETLKEKIKDSKDSENKECGVKWTLKTIIKSYGNSCSLKTVKAELVPSLLTASEWTSWNTKAKNILENDPSFVVDKNDSTKYTVRENNFIQDESEESLENGENKKIKEAQADKISREFKVQKDFFKRIDILMRFYKEFIDSDDSSDLYIDLFAEMYSYFTNYLKNITRVTEQVLAAYLVSEFLSARDKQFAFPIKETFAELYSKIEDPREIFTLLKDTKNTTLKSEFIEHVKLLPDWDIQYVYLFPKILDKKIIDYMISKGKTDAVQKLVKNCFENFKDFRESVIFFFKECREEEWFINSGVSFEKQLVTLVNVIELTFREINSHVNSTENKKINKNATNLLFDENALYKYISESNEETVKKMYTLVDDLVDIDPKYKQSLRNKILEKYPDFKFRIATAEKTTQNSGIIVTQAKLTEKKAEAEKIQKEELPANAKDLAEAKAKGDLKENAEYQAAKERQHLLNVTLERLNNEIARAVIFDPTTSTTAVVSFATVVTLHNNNTNEDEVYTILGPWESDPDKNVISYMSPFGNALMDKKANQEIHFTVNERKFSYTVKKIEKAKI